MVPKLHSCICGRIWEMGRTTWSILCQEESHILSTVEMPHKWLSRVTYFKSAYRCMFFSLACAKWSDLSHLGQLRQTCQGRSKQVCVCLGPDQGCWFKVCSDTDSCYERLLWHWNVLYSWGGITILEEGRSHALSVYIHGLHSQWTHISQVSLAQLTCRQVSSPAKWLLLLNNHNQNHLFLFLSVTSINSYTFGFIFGYIFIFSFGFFDLVPQQKMGKRYKHTVMRYTVKSNTQETDRLDR